MVKIEGFVKHNFKDADFSNFSYRKDMDKDKLYVFDAEILNAAQIIKNFSSYFSGEPIDYIMYHIHTSVDKCFRDKLFSTATGGWIVDGHWNKEKFFPSVALQPSVFMYFLTKGE